MHVKGHHVIHAHRHLPMPGSLRFGFSRVHDYAWFVGSVCASPRPFDVSQNGVHLCSSPLLTVATWSLRHMLVKPSTFKRNSLLGQRSGMHWSGFAFGPFARRPHGNTQWLFSAYAGAAARCAGPTLTACQHGDTPKLQESDRLVLRCLRALALSASSRRLLVVPAETVYRDLHRCSC